MSIAHSKRGKNKKKMGKKMDLGVGTAPFTWERGLLPTRSLRDRAGMNIYLEATERQGNHRWRLGTGGTDGSEEDHPHLWWICGTGREMPLNCTDEASPHLPRTNPTSLLPGLPQHSC